MRPDVTTIATTVHGHQGIRHCVSQLPSLNHHAPAVGLNFITHTWRIISFPFPDAHISQLRVYLPPCGRHGSIQEHALLVLPAVSYQWLVAALDPFPPGNSSSLL